MDSVYSSNYFQLVAGHAHAYPLDFTNEVEVNGIHPPEQIIRASRGQIVCEYMQIYSTNVV